MRIDQFLNAVNLVKNRALAQDMIRTKVIYINDIVAKNAKHIAVGDTITMRYLDHTKAYKIIALPQTKHTKKSDQSLYVKLI